MDDRITQCFLAIFPPFSAKVANYFIKFANRGERHPIVKDINA